ncbi:hypothetical protein J5N97_013401 [Dioscorea zingiberensis]|uniref:cysteine dioxygenase n=1 Tax=Dioscorea zingiberensis TaxID=325984 RepID=A0A9D5HJ03_9LILI|nr:hypothetical protein J5N97_013401 [Dioscorea zingiberensis]
MLLSSTDYGPFLQNEPSPLHTTTLVEKCTLKLVDDYKHMLCQATEPLSIFLEYIMYGHMIDNVVLIVTGTLHERDVQELLEKCHPLSVSFTFFPSIATLAVAQNMRELYRLALIDTPLAPYFSECITSEIMRNTLYKAYLEDFYNFCKKLGGATAEIMGDLLAFEADRRAVNITINSIGTELTRDDRKKLYSNFALLYPYGHEELVVCEDIDQVRAAMEKYPPYQAIYAKISYGESQMLDKACYEDEVKRLYLTFEQQFYYGVFFIYMRLREQEIRNPILSFGARNAHWPGYATNNDILFSLNTDGFQNSSKVGFLMRLQGEEVAPPRSSSRKGRRRHKKAAAPTAVQRLFDTCREVFFDGAPGVVPAPEDVGRLKSVLDNMKPADVGLAQNSPYFIKTNTKGAPPVTYLHLYECDNFSIGIFCLPPSAVIPLHNHPGMTVFSKLLFGSMHIKSYDWVDAPQNSIKTTNPPHEVKLAKLKKNAVFSASSETSILYPASGGNLHCFTATTSCAVLDVLGPPYSDPEGRHCTYYKDFPYSSFSVNGISMAGEDGEHAWLEEREKPDDFVVVGAKYWGPRIVE